MSAADAAAAFAAGSRLHAGGDRKRAAAEFLMAFALSPDTPAYRRAAFGVLNLMTGYRQLPAPVLEGLRVAARNPTLDVQPLSLVVKNLMAGNPRSEPREVLADPLVRAVLTRAVNISPALESICVAMRRELCLAVTDGAQLAADDRDALCALACQCVINGYLWPESTAETTAVPRLRARHDADALLVRACYDPLAQFSATEAGTLPSDVAAFWREQQDERHRAAQMPEAVAVASGLSTAMQAQYQVFPYPRWRTFDAPGPVPWDTFLQRAMPLERAGWPQGREILVAGCGTGLSTLTLATLLPEAQILAVDLSRTSLAYASRKAQELGVTNVQFAVGDILHLDHLRRRFDFIECSGVLHHMQEPAEGLRALRRALAPDGVLLLSLYSARGRRAEAAAQSLVAEKGWHDDMAGLRAARAALLTLPEGHPATGVCATPDFFTRDGLHDLIFNLHESRMTPADVKALTAACELRVAAVDPPDPDAAAAFRQRHPQPAAAQDLDLWDAFEADHPTIFAHMIRVWCRPA